MRAGALRTPSTGASRSSPRSIHTWDRNSCPTASPFRRTPGRTTGRASSPASPPAASRRAMGTCNFAAAGSISRRATRSSSRNRSSPDRRRRSPSCRPNHSATGHRRSIGGAPPARPIRCAAPISSLSAETQASSSPMRRCPRCRAALRASPWPRSFSTAARGHASRFKACICAPAGCSSRRRSCSRKVNSSRRRRAICRRR